MSLVVAAFVIGAGTLAASLAARAALAKKPAAAPEPAATKPASPLAEAGFEIELGDVVEIAGQELWLERGWLLREAGEVVAALFGAREKTLLVLPAPSRRVYLLDEIELALPEEPPATLESGGIRFERARRLPVELEPLAKTPPLPWDHALFGEYRGLGNDVIFVLGRGAHAKIWQGRVAVESEIERWGGGAATL